MAPAPAQLTELELVPAQVSWGPTPYMSPLAGQVSPGQPSLVGGHFPWQHSLAETWQEVSGRLLLHVRPPAYSLHPMMLPATPGPPRKGTSLMSSARKRA